MKQKMYIPIQDGHDITALYGSPDDAKAALSQKKLAIMLHDFPASDKNGIDGMFERTEKVLNKRGFHTIRFDFMGCGDREGMHDELTLQTCRRDLNAVVQWAEKLGRFDRILLVAEGFGALPALMFNRNPILAYILLYPALNPQLLLSQRFKVEKGDANPIENAAGYMVIENTKVSQKLVRELQDLKIEQYYHLAEAPCLIQHGANDTVITIDHLDMARQHLKVKRIDLTVYEPGNHGLNSTPKERDMAIFHIDQFLQKFV